MKGSKTANKNDKEQEGHNTIAENTMNKLMNIIQKQHPGRQESDLLNM